VAVGLKASRIGQQDIHVFFDKATALPLRTFFKWTMNNGQEETFDFNVSDYKEFNGRKHFTKASLYHDGNVEWDAELSDFRWLEKLEATVFELP
jgi:hypothetical protein